MGSKRKHYHVTTTTDDRLVSGKRHCKQSRVGNFEKYDHPTLKLYYGQISTLRQYLLARLPRSCQKRRHRLAAVKRTERCRTASSAGMGTPGFDDRTDEDLLAQFLDGTLICAEQSHEKPVIDRQRDFGIYSQQISLTAGGSVSQSASSQIEVRPPIPQCPPYGV